MFPYVILDDILIMENGISMLLTVKIWLSKNFFMKDLGEAIYILRMRIYRDRSKRLLGFSQSIYIDKMIKRFGMENSKKGLLAMSHGMYSSRDM